MPVAELSYCPQCILFVFAAMGVYQYVVRDRIRNGSTDENDNLFDMDVEQMDADTQLMLLDLLTNDHTLDRSPNANRPSPNLIVDQTRLV